MQHANSIPAHVLDVITRSPAEINTSEIYSLVREAENITVISVTCRDLLIQNKVQRRMLNGRWHYRPRQLDLLAPAPAANEDFKDDVQPRRGAAAARKATAHKVSGRITPANTPTRAIKLRVLDRLTEIVAADIAAVLRSIRTDLEQLA